MSENALPPISIYIVGILLTIVFIFAVIKSIMISRIKDKIMKWQKEALYAKYRKEE